MAAARDPLGDKVKIFKSSANLLWERIFDQQKSPDCLPKCFFWGG
jgi:hypothetical protein